jgi:hypothetical protein
VCGACVRACVGQMSEDDLAALITKCSNSLWSLRESSLLELAAQVELRGPPARTLLAQAPRIVEAASERVTVYVCASVRECVRVCERVCIIQTHTHVCLCLCLCLCVSVCLSLSLCACVCVGRALQSAAGGACAALGLGVEPRRVSLSTSRHGPEADPPAAGGQEGWQPQGLCRAAHPPVLRMWPSGIQAYENRSLFGHVLGLF